MTLMQLTYFVQVVEVGNLTRAAEELLIAQPSLSQSIRKLEDELKFTLFEKNGRTLILTREGKEFLQYAKGVLDSAEKARSTAERLRRENSGSIRFAYTEPTPQNYIPDLMEGFMELEKNKDVRLSSYVAGTTQIVADLREDSIDFGFCSQVADKHEDLLLYPILTQPVVLIAPINDPLCSLGQVHPADLVSRPGISYALNSSMYWQLKSFWDEQEITPDIRHRSSAGKICGLVSRGLGWAIIAMTEDFQRDDVSVLSMPELQLTRTIYLAMRVGRKFGAAAERFRDYILSLSQSPCNIYEET